MNAHGVLVQRLDFPVRPVALIVNVGFLVFGAVHREKHVFRRELPVSLVKLDAFSEMEGPCLEIFGGLPAFRQIGLQRLRVHGSGCRASQAIEDDR